MASCVCGMNVATSQLVGLKYCAEISTVAISS